MLKVNTSLEVHASKIYTRKMFEIFGGILYESGMYDVEEIIEKQKYIVTHRKAELREKWFKCRFEVNVSDNLGYFSCICGLFEHMGMVCCHSLQVMVLLRLKQIPSRHILKRWSIHGRDNLPSHLKHYQQDMVRRMRPLSGILLCTSLPWRLQIWGTGTRRLLSL